MSVPSPLGEQIAHAIDDALGRPLGGVGWSAGSSYPRSAKAQQIIDAVLPLVEAAAATERGRAAGDRETVEKYGLRALVNEEVCEAVTRFQTKPSVLSPKQIDSVTDRLMRYFEAAAAAERDRLRAEEAAP